ncbi:hypothetical protein Stsp02_09530 [Streptomyces sp. NBRC 14336]|uniref:hypothetical protein n=1 Tax=Streptomyces sp. NBRC 14336 TaxID=3030992 RepID=UPI0024A269FD|nr:hypothetical protein [Streptomyces sp. NBRC 14336]GLW45291.1 hypothetical protein Stsp02_09530 [Streptomyces sp. NBRC 14336]
MSELTLALPPDLHEQLLDLADATGRGAEDIALDAVRDRVAAEAGPVREAAEVLAAAHADLLRRLGE